MPSSHTYICLLRGINVGGHGKLPMAQLRDICEELGCSDVSTYVQSGNVILTSSLGADQLRDRLESAIEAAAGFRPPVVVRTRADLVKVLDANPYPDTEAKFMHVGFMSARPTKAAIADLDDIDCSPEGFTVAGKEIYLNYVNGAGQSKKLARIPFEKKLGVSITARNLRTVAALIDRSTP